MKYLEWIQKTPEVFEMSGIEEYIRKEKEESVRVMRRRLKRGKDTGKGKAEEILGEANKMYVRGELERSVELIKEALRYHTTSESAYYLLGVIYDEMGESEKSFNAFLITASIKKTDIALWKRLYALKKAEKNTEYQIYILKRMKKLENSLDILEEMHRAYAEQKNTEKIVETEAEMAEHTGFREEFVESLILTIRSLKNRGRIIDILGRGLNKEKHCADATDAFLIGYIDVLFMEQRYREIERISNTLLYLGREIDCIRTKIFVFFSTLITEIGNKCRFCAKEGNALCACRSTLFVDSAEHILFVSGADTVLINAELDPALLADPLHLDVTLHFTDTLARMKKGPAVQTILEKVDREAERLFPIQALPHDREHAEVATAIIRSRFEIKKRLAAIYERSKEYEKSVLALKEILRHKDTLPQMNEVFEEIKMKISQVYEKAENIDLALEYALQIQSKEQEKDRGIARNRLVFSTRAECTRAQSLLYKADHILGSEVVNSAGGEHSLFLQSTRELVQIFLKNTFVFSNKKKKRKDLRPADRSAKTEEEAFSAENLLSTKEFENDFALLQEIHGLGAMFYSEDEGKVLTPQRKVYFDVLASLLSGISLPDWHRVLRKYVIFLHQQKMYSAALLLLKKALASPVLRTSFEIYTSLLWMSVKISIDSKDFGALSAAVTRIMLFYPHRIDVDPSSFYFLAYFLAGQIPQFHKKIEFYSLQKNIQRNMKRKALRHGARRAEVFTLLAFSYMPSFVSTETVRRLESLFEKSGLPAVDTSILGISRAISQCSIFLTYASSRKVTDRDRYIKKGLFVLRAHINRLQNSFSHRISQEPGVHAENGQLTYVFEKPEAKKSYYYTEDSHTEKLALLFYNIARAYHQFKVLGIAEAYYVLSIRYAESPDTVRYAKTNLSLMKKKVRMLGSAGDAEKSHR